MKRYAILIALAAMLCGTEARAATIGFDSQSNGTFPFDYMESGFKVSGTGQPWSVVSNAVGHSISSVPSGGHVLVELPTVQVDHNGTPRFELPEFTVESFQIASYGNLNTTFIIQGLHGGNPPDFLFTLNLTPTASDVFQMISLADFHLIPGDSSSMLLSDIRVQQLVITGIHGSDVDSYRLDNFNLGTTDTSTLPPGMTCNDKACTPVPEPASLLLLGAGLAGIGIWRRKARR